jgi:hypothetical protein
VLISKIQAGPARANFSMKQCVLMGWIHGTNITSEGWVCLNDHVGTLSTSYWFADNPGLLHGVP